MTFEVYSSGYPLTGVPTGNTWGVDIRGAAPYQVVTIYQHLPGGGDNSFVMGATDENGDYTMRYLLGQNQLGQWHSYWTVGTDKVGEYDFMVLPGPGPTSGYQIVDPQVIKALAVGAQPTQFQAGEIQPVTFAIAPAAARIITAPRSRIGRAVKPMFVGIGAVGVGAAGGPIGIAIGVAVAIGSILGGLFGGLFGGGGVSRDQIDALRQSIVDIGNTITAAISAVMHALGKVLKFLKGIWTDVIHPLLDQVRKLIDQILRIYDKILKPMLDWIRRIRARIMQIYEQWLRPILLVMQRLHQILTILKLFHIKFAAKLDAQLMALEAKLTAPLFYVLRQLNSLANVFNLVLTGGLLLQRALLLRSLDATKGSWVRMFYNAHTSNVTADDVAAFKASNHIPTPAETTADVQQFFGSGTGPMADRYNAGIELAEATFQE